MSYFHGSNNYFLLKQHTDFIPIFSDSMPCKETEIIISRDKVGLHIINIYINFAANINFLHKNYTLYNIMFTMLHLTGAFKTATPRNFKKEQQLIKVILP